MNNVRVKPVSKLEEEVGWLAPDGKYYPCRYEGADRESFWHLRKAREIIAWFYPDAEVGDSDYGPDGGPQQYLVDQGWIRTDIKHLWFAQRPTQEQIDTLFDLRKLCKRGILPTEQLRLVLAWSGLAFLAKPGDEYYEFEASVPDANLPRLKAPKNSRL